MFFSCIHFLIMIKLIISSSYSDNVMKVQEYQKMEKQAKILACSMLADSSIIPKRKENKIKKYLKKNNFLDDSEEYENLEKIKQFKTAICYDKISFDKANDVLTALREGNFDFINDKSMADYFDFDSKDDFKELTKNMKETNKIMEDLRKEEEERKNDDSYYEESLKDLKSKIYKNPKYEKNGDKFDFNSKDLTTDKLEREKNKREIEDDELTFKNIIEHPEILRKYIGIKTFIGFIIFMIIITIIDNKNQKRMQEEEEKQNKMKENENKSEEKNKEENKDKNDNNINIEENNNNKDIKKNEIKKEKKE